MGLKRGASLPLVDQLDFVVGAWVFAYLTAPEWFVSNFTRGIMLTVLIMTPLLHLTTNIIGYFIGVKKEPGENSQGKSINSFTERKTEKFIALIRLQTSVRK